MNRSGVPVDLILSRLAQDMDRARKRSKKAAQIMVSPLNTRISETPYEVVYTEDRVKLKHYLPPNRPEGHIQTPLLMVYALINRETMLDLQPDRSVIRSMLDAGMELYVVDWGYPTKMDRFVGIGDHVNGYMNNIVDFIRRRHDLEQINLMGICMGGTFSLIYSALYPEKIKNLITTVTPSNFDTDDGLLHIWMKYVDPDALVEAYGNVPGDIMNLGFLLLNPARLMIDKYVGFTENFDSMDYVENFIRMEKWIFDSPDVPGETFRQFIRDFYQKNLLIQNRYELEGKHVDLNRITMPLLNIYAQFDHLVPPGAANLITSRVGSHDTEDFRLETGHIGIYVSSKSKKEFVPKIISWLSDRDADRASIHVKDYYLLAKDKQTGAEHELL